MDTLAIGAATGAAIAIGFSGLGVALGQGILTKVSVETLGENPNLASSIRIFTILGVALVESAAIYGFIVAFQIIGAGDGMGTYQAIGAGLAVGLTALGAGYGEGRLIAGGLGALARNPDNKAMTMQFMILFVALVESAAIYGLIVAQKILNS